MTDERTFPPSRYVLFASACSGRSYALAGALLFAGALGKCEQASSAPAPSPERKSAASTVTLPAEAAGASAPQKVAQSQHQTPTTRTYMLSHFADSVRMREAIVAGKLVEAQAAAAAVASDPWSPRLRGDYRPHLQAVRDSARLVQEASSLPAAAAGLGKLGEMCATCHLKFGGPGSPVAPVQLNAQADPGMLAHALATDRLWQGLSAPSDQTWLTGARALLDSPALDSDVAEVAAAARQLRELAQQSTGAVASQRGKIFGNVVATCAACHERLGINLVLRPH